MENYLTFMVDNTSYAINVSSVLEVLNMTKPTAVPCALSYIEGLIYSREQGITVVNLRKRFELEDHTKYDEFVSSLDIAHENRDFMKFVPDYITYNVRTEAVFNGLAVMKKFRGALTAATYTIILLLTLFVYREDLRETGILYSLGIKKSHLTLCGAAGNTGYLIIVSLVSVCLGFLLSSAVLITNSYFASLDLTFSVTPEILCLLVLFSLSGGMFSALASAVFLSGKAPAELSGRN